MGLWWEWNKYTLPSGKTVDDVKTLVATNAFYGLPSLGYTDIDVEVARACTGRRKVSSLQ